MLSNQVSSKGKFNTEYLQASTPGSLTKVRDNWKINTTAKGAIKNRRFNLWRCNAV